VVGTVVYTASWDSSIRSYDIAVYLSPFNPQLIPSFHLIRLANSYNISLVNFYLMLVIQLIIIKNSLLGGHTQHIYALCAIIDAQDDEVILDHTIYSGSADGTACSWNTKVKATFL
jgi:hypothetical protein